MDQLPIIPITISADAMITDCGFLNLFQESRPVKFMCRNFLINTKATTMRNIRMVIPDVSVAVCSSRSIWDKYSLRGFSSHRNDMKPNSDAMAILISLPTNNCRFRIDN